jgi:uncharacterized protein YjbJ (UPF0337 family)
MSWNNVEKNWNTERNKLKVEWGKLTDDDIEVINGRRPQLEVLLQKYYGYDPLKAQSEVDMWLRQF